MPVVTSRGRLADLSRTASIMPLSLGPGEAQHGRMPNRRHIPTRRTGNEPALVSPPRLLVTNSGDPTRLVLESNGYGLRFLTRLFAFSLDRRLASGEAPESGRLMASRASRLVSPPERAALAQNWDHLVRRARRPPAGRTSRAPLCWERIMRARDDIGVMVSSLSAPVPTSVRGVAMASCLLSDANGPLYNRHSDADLVALLRQATAELDPAASLLPLP